MRHIQKARLVKSAHENGLEKPSQIMYVKILSYNLISLLTNSNYWALHAVIAPSEHNMYNNRYLVKLNELGSEKRYLYGAVRVTFAMKFSRKECR